MSNFDIPAWHTKVKKERKKKGTWDMSKSRLNIMPIANDDSVINLIHTITLTGFRSHPPLSPLTHHSNHHHLRLKPNQLTDLKIRSKILQIHQHLPVTRIPSQIPLLPFIPPERV